MRMTLTMLAHRVFMMLSRGTMRKCDDHHLCQQYEKTDVHHWETHSNIEVFANNYGFKSHPVKQSESKQKQQAQTSQPKGFIAQEQQPTGEACENIICYVGGERSHPVVIARADRRFEPYDTPEGSSMMHDQHQQVVYIHPDKGVFIASLDSEDGKTKRYASIRHVKKKPQPREITDVSAQSKTGTQQGQQQEEYKHEGKDVDLEMRVTEKRVEFRSGDDVVAHYDKDDGQWQFYGKSDAAFGVGGGRYTRMTGSKVHLGIKDPKGTAPCAVMTECGLSKVVFAVVD